MSRKRRKYSVWVELDIAERIDREAERDIPWKPSKSFTIRKLIKKGLRL